MVLLELLLRALGAVVLGSFAILRALLRGGVALGGILLARSRLRDGLRCPRGHRVPTDGETYHCGECGYRYENDSMWLCPNPECGAPTPYVNCPTCGLSVSSPYRFLHG